MEKRIVAIFIFAIGLCFLGSDVIYSKTLISIIVGTILLSYTLMSKYHWSVCIAFNYTLLNAIHVFAYRDNWFQNLLPVVKNAIFYNTFYALFIFMLSFFLVDRIKEDIKKPVGVLSLILSFGVIFQYIITGNLENGGFFGNASINASFIAITSPFILSLPLKRAYLYLGIPLIACLISGSSIGLIAMFLCLALLTIIYADRNIKLPIVLGLSLIGLIFGKMYLGQEFFNDNHRFEFWVLILKWWKTHCNMFVGLGVGTIYKFGRVIQEQYNYHLEAIYLFSHNDFLDLLFEQGIIGLLLYMNVIIHAIIKSKDRLVKASMIVYILAASFNWVTHHFLGIFLAMYFILNTLKKGENYE